MIWITDTSSLSSLSPAVLYTIDIDISHNSDDTGLILGLRPANERRRYKVTLSLFGWVQPRISPVIYWHNDNWPVSLQSCWWHYNNLGPVSI